MKVLITGGSGLLGSHLYLSCKNAFNYVSIPSSNRLNITQISTTQITTLSAYDIVINCAAYVDIKKCEENPEKAYWVNAESLGWLVQLAHMGVQVYHISSDYVYDGYTKNSKETDVLNPFNVYSKSKAAGDTLLLSYSHPNIHIIRTSFKDIGPNKKWKYPQAFTDQFTNADTVAGIAKLIQLLISLQPPGGVYNVGTERKSLYSLIHKYDKNVQPATIQEQHLQFLRPEVSMDLTKLTMLL